MKNKSVYASLFILAPFLLSLSACRDALIDPYSPKAIAGTYSLSSFTDKRDDTVYLSGIPVDTGRGQKTILTGTIELTQTRFILTRTWVVSENGEVISDYTEVIVGDYFIEDEVFKILEDETGRFDFIPIVVTVDGFVLEDIEFKLIFTRE